MSSLKEYPMGTTDTKIGEFKYPENLIRELYGDEVCYDINDEILDNIFNVIETKLSDMTREAIYYRYREDFTFKEIGEQLNRSTSRARKIVNDGLNKIKKYVNITFNQIITSTAYELSIEILGLNDISYNSLKDNYIDTIDDLMYLEKDELYDLPGMSIKCVQNIIRILEANGIDASKFK